MPFDLSALRSNTATCRVDYGDAGDINITYRPANITERSIADLHFLGDRDETDWAANMAAINRLLVQLVVEWDLTHRGEPVALTEDALSLVPIEVRGDVVRAIFEDARLGESTGTASAPTSRAISARKPRSSSGKRA